MLRRFVWHYWYVYTNESIVIDCQFQWSVFSNIQAVEERRFDPNHVGNSIKALALSVQDTSLFGELPRPRMHQSSHRKW